MKSRIISRELTDESKLLKEQRKVMEAELRKVENDKKLILVRAKRVPGKINSSSFLLNVSKRRLH